MSELNPTKCQAIIWSEVTKKQRQCRNFAGHSGFCPRHRNGSNAEPRTQTRKPAVPLPVQELEAARKAIAAARDFLHDPAKKGRFVEALSVYDDIVRSSK